MNRVIMSYSALVDPVMGGLRPACPDNLHSPKARIGGRLLSAHAHAHRNLDQ